MKRASSFRPFRLSCLAALLVAVPAAQPALACGEAAFNAGKGLEFQGYLAPRPATVLVYGTPDPTVSDKQREDLLAGLRDAGHSVRVVANADAYAQALRDGPVDLVIANADALQSLTTAGGSTQAPRLLPVVARGDRAAGAAFDQFVRTGARLGQYLRAIDLVVAAAR